MKKNSKIILITFFCTIFNFIGFNCGETGFKPIDSINKIFEFSNLQKNIIDIGNINYNQNIKNNKFIPSGELLGFVLDLNGALVVETSFVNTEFGTVKTNNFNKGDVIKKVNNKIINSNDDLANVIETSEGKDIHAEYDRDQTKLESTITPVKSTDGSYKIGIWVQDSVKFLGTNTFFNKDTHDFYALGHGFFNPCNEKLLKTKGGEIFPACCNSIKKSEKGSPGEIIGSLIGTNYIGKVLNNTNNGIHGKLNENFVNNIDIKNELEIASIDEIKIGKAQVLCTISKDGPRSFDIEITNINLNEKDSTKRISIEVCKELEKNTNGIVQGFSGSPLIQDRKIVGAITHVLVNDPKKGFASSAHETISTAK
ncbi:MAG: SpoIVB peptidase [Candidatus Paraimprobicoccus trichonymphae]|uniref:SpoIVB peptidase n=1 Tax=Candidatus Paraimprobicoccus trichonymphae TaxID=3033793 RepID=A0AA48IAE0_9FIRM|nr:MAG: SpoIVB peptidase [Candidatus Paraimprobicoccus trichonymphae]